MVSTFTPNINLEEPARGDDVGTWDTPVNANMTLLDLTIGANTAISVGSGNVTLSAAQFKSAALTFSSTLIQNTTITFPSTFLKGYDILHTATGSSAFTITLATTVSGGQVVAVPPGQGVRVYNDGTNFKFIGGLLPIGGYWDYCGSSVPNWVSASTVPPYLNCDGSAVSSATYPLLFNLGITTLPDSKGRYRANLNQGTTRLKSAYGVNGDLLGVGGGDDHNTLTSAMIPVVPDTHQHYVLSRDIQDFGLLYEGGNQLGGVEGFGTSGRDNFSTPVSSIGQIGNSSPTSFSILGPTYVGGLTMIRAA